MNENIKTLVCCKIIQRNRLCVPKYPFREIDTPI